MLQRIRRTGTSLCRVGGSQEVAQLGLKPMMAAPKHQPLARRGLQYRKIVALLWIVPLLSLVNVRCREGED